MVEMVIVVAIVAILVAVAIPALSTAKNDSETTKARATAKVLNEARDRAIVQEAGGIKTRADWDATYGNNVTNAVAFLKEQGFFTTKE